MEIKQLYKVYDSYNIWYNYFFEIGDIVKYLFIDSEFDIISYNEENIENLKEILEAFKFEKVKLFNNKKKVIITKIFK